MIIPVTHCLPGDITEDGYRFHNGNVNESGKFITTWTTPLGNLAVYALSVDDKVNITTFASI